MEAPFEISRKWSTRKIDSGNFSAGERNQETVLTVRVRLSFLSVLMPYRSLFIDSEFLSYIKVTNFFLLRCLFSPPVLWIIYRQYKDKLHVDLI